MSVDIALSRLLCVRGQSIVEATVCPWKEHCRGYCISVDIPLSMLLCNRGQSIERGYCVSVDGALTRLLCVRGHSIVEAILCPWT